MSVRCLIVVPASGRCRVASKTIRRRSSAPPGEFYDIQHVSLLDLYSRASVSAPDSLEGVQL